MPNTQPRRNLKLGDFTNLVMNKRTRQYSLNLKKKECVKFGLSPKDILKIKIPEGNW